MKKNKLIVKMVPNLEYKEGVSCQFADEVNLAPIKVQCAYSQLFKKVMSKYQARRKI